MEEGNITKWLRSKMNQIKPCKSTAQTDCIQHTGQTDVSHRGFKNVPKVTCMSPDLSMITKRGLKVVVRPRWYRGIRVCSRNKETINL